MKPKGKLSPKERKRAARFVDAMLEQIDAAPEIAILDNEALAERLKGVDVDVTSIDAMILEEAIERLGQDWWTPRLLDMKTDLPPVKRHQILWWCPQHSRWHFGSLWRDPRIDWEYFSSAHCVQDAKDVRLWMPTPPTPPTPPMSPAEDRGDE